MNLAIFFSDMTIKAKQKTEKLCEALVSGTISGDELLAFASSAKPPVKATCIEAIEFATRTSSNKIDKRLFAFAVESLNDKAPRMKWEAAKLIGNTAKDFKKHLDDAIHCLLINTEDEGTVVRWSAAFALSEILKLNTQWNEALIPAIEAIINREEKSSIKKIYLSAMKVCKR